jgi:predicted N-acetyltransferase YhbS
VGHDIEIHTMEAKPWYEGALRLTHDAFLPEGGGKRGRFDLDAVDRRERSVGIDRSLGVVAVAGRCVVGSVFVIPYKMRVGVSTVDVAGIRYVGVHPRYRGWGICGRMMRAVLERLPEAGIPVSVLFGIPHLYEQFGYVPAMTWLTTRHEVGRIIADVGNWRVRRFAAGDTAWAVRLYNRMTRRSTGCAVRRDRPRKLPEHAHVLESPDGCRQGYVFWIRDARRNELRVEEVVTKNASVVDPMLGFLKEQAGAAGLPTVRISLHHQHPCLGELRYRWACVEEQFSDSGGPMVAVRNLLRALRAIRRELEGRAQAYPGRWPGGGLVIASDCQRVRIDRTRTGLQIEEVAGGPVDLAAGEDIGRFFMGHGDPAVIIRQRGLRVRREKMPLIGSLFPNQAPHMSPLGAY